MKIGAIQVVEPHGRLMLKMISILKNICLPTLKIIAIRVDHTEVEDVVADVGVEVEVETESDRHQTNNKRRI